MAVKKKNTSTTAPGYPKGEFVWPTETQPGANEAEIIGHQVRNSTRWLHSQERNWSVRHPDGLPHPETNQHKRILKAIPENLQSSLGKQIGPHPGIWKTQDGVSPEGDALEIANKLIGAEPFENASGEIEPLEMKHLYRSYKNTPHAPTSMFLKYLVHRINNLNEYNDPATGHALDVKFRDLVQYGGAAYKNGHVSIENLHDWTGRWASSIVPELIKHRNALQSSIAKDIGLNVRDVNGEPYVALTRGLNDELMAHEHPLSSHADVPETGFGNVMHHSWVPLKDVWYAFDIGPKYTHGTFGPENEWLVSNTGTRYQATVDDVKPHRIRNFGDFYNEAPPVVQAAIHGDASDEQLAAAAEHYSKLNLPIPYWLMSHKNAGPVTYQTVLSKNRIPDSYYGANIVPREAALGVITGKIKTGPLGKGFAMQNPHLTPDDLVLAAKNFLGDENYTPVVSTSGTESVIRDWLSNPKMNSHVLEQAWHEAPDSPHKYLLLASPLATPTMLQGAVDKLKATDFDYAHHANILDNFSVNPHHTEQQAGDIYNAVVNGGGLQMPGVPRALGMLKLPYSAVKELFEKADGPITGTPSDFDKIAAHSAFSAFIDSNPHSAPVIAKLVAEKDLPISSLESRLVRKSKLEPELQGAFIRLAQKETDPYYYMNELASTKDLTQDSISALANDPSDEVRETLFSNKSVTAEQIKEAYPKEWPFPKLVKTPYGTDVEPRMGKVAASIAGAYYRRKAWEERVAKEHVIKPLPQNLAKSEDMWRLQARDWLSKQKVNGYYYPTTQERASNILRDKAIEPDFTDELLHGEAVFAHRATPTYLDSWRKTAGPDDAVVYFETPATPESHEDRFYWTNRVPIENARIADVSTEGPLAKFHAPLLFPKLGIGDDRRETKLVSTPLERKTFMRAAAAQASRENVIGAGVDKAKNDPEYRQDLIDRTYKRYSQAPSHGITIEGVAGPGMPGHGMRAVDGESTPGAGQGQSAISAAFTAEAFPKSKKWGAVSAVANADPRMLGATATHENLHRIFARVQHKYGAVGRMVLAQNLLYALPKDLSDAMLQHLFYRRPDFKTAGYKGNPQEEAITELNSYLSLPVQRDSFHKSRQDSSEQQQAFHDKMKRAYRLLQAISATVDEKWLNRTRPWLKKGEATVPFHEVQSTGMSAQQAHDVFKASTKLSKAQPELLAPNKFAFEYENDLALQDTISERVEEIAIRKAAYVEDEELKSLYRQAAKTFHPDLAVDDSDRTARTSKLQELNTAYQRRDVGSIRRMLGIKATFAHTPTGGKLPLGKSEDNITLPNEGVFEPGEESIARMVLGHRKEHERCLAAARFLIGRKEEVDDDMFRVALGVYDGDPQRAALIAVGLTDSEPNLRAIRAALKLGEFSLDHVHELTKGEVIKPFITDVRAGAPDAQDTADAVSRAVTAGLVQPIVLGGKHSKGAMAARDPKTGATFLIKPGSGKQSPAAGARDDGSSQSAREAAFWHCADRMGMGNYFPRADLLLVNGAEVAAIKLFGTKWKSLDERNRQVDGYAREVLAPYLKRGDIHRLAFLDGILANADSHGQNWLVHAESVAGIDHGSAFAGPNFDPGHDSKSFTPYPLRCFAASGYSKKTPEERIQTMPILDPDADDAFRKWVRSIDPAILVETMQSHDIGEIAQKAVVARLDKLQRYDGPSLSGQLNAQWAGVDSWQ